MTASKRPNLEAVTPGFLKQMSDEEWQEFFNNDGVLSSDQTARLWALAGGDPRNAPACLRMMLRREDVEKRWPKKTPGVGKRRRRGQHNEWKK